MAVTARDRSRSRDRTAAEDKKQRSVVVTGASNGQGRALVKALAARNFAVYACDVVSTSKADMEAEVAALPGKLHFMEVDVTDSSNVRKWAACVLKDLNGEAPDFLLNVAGLTFEAGGPGTPQLNFWELPEEKFNKTIQVNVLGVANVIRSFLPAMIEKRKGIVLNWSSGLGRSTNPKSVAYCASKFAVEALSKAISQSVPKGMAVCPLAPGLVLSQMQKAIPGQHIRTPDEWAAVAVPFILSIDTDSQNGCSLSIPGGYEAAYMASWVIPDGHCVPPLGQEF